MSYSRKIVQEVNLEFENRLAFVESDRNRRLDIAYEKAPELLKLDNEIQKTSVKILGAAMQGKDGLSEKINAIRQEVNALKEKREEILEACGLDKHFTDYKYACELCNDHGFVNGQACICRKKELTKRQLEASGLGKLLDTQSFESFSFDYYTEKEEIKELVSYLEEYVEEFGNNSKSLLFVGGTGLGKTHLSTAVARVLIEKGHNVVYETAQNIFSDFEKDRFRDHYDTSYEVLGDRYLDCDLLIIDDLGTEMVTSYSVACLYNIINTRLNRGLPIIASTNLSSGEIRKIYHDRITSRLFGEFSIQKFVGSDMRKLSKKI